MAVVSQTTSAAVLVTSTVQELKQANKSKYSEKIYSIYDVEVGNFVRRPLQGMHPKPNSYASLTLASRSGDPIELSGRDKGLVNSSTPSGNSIYTTNFLIQSLSESRQEKSQPVPTFGDTFYYFFGQQPVQLQVSAILLNSADFEWEIEWWHNYEASLRGTRLVDRNRRVSLTYESTTITGFISTCSVQKNANTPMEAGLQFTMFIDRKSYQTSKGESPGANTFRLNAAFADNLIQQDKNYYTGSSLKVKTLAENLEFLKNTPDIDAKAYSGVILADSWAPRALEIANIGLDIALDPIGTFQEYLTKKENEITVLASEAINLDIGKAIATAAGESPLKSVYTFSEILGEYVSRPTKDFSSMRKAEEFYENLSSTLASNMDAAIEAMNKDLGNKGLRIVTDASVGVGADIEYPIGLEASFEREVGRRKAKIQEGLKNNAIFMARVGVLEATRAATRGSFYGMNVRAEDSPTEDQVSADVSALLNSQSEDG